MTGRWETSLSKIVDGKVSATDFDASIRRYVVALTSEILATDDLSLRAAVLSEAEPDALKCPRCGGPMKIWDTNVKCKACGHSIWRTVAGKLLTENMLTRLMTNGSTQVLKGFRSKAGKNFDAALRLDSEGRIAFDFTKVDSGAGNARRSRPMIVSTVSASSPDDETPPPPTVEDYPYWQ